MYLIVFLAYAALVRPFGNLVAEIPVICTRPEFRHCGLASLLLRQIEATLIRYAHPHLFI